MRNMFVIAVLLLVFPFESADAQVIVRTGDTVSIQETETVQGNFYSLTNIFNVSGTIEGDMVVAAGRATLNGSVSEDALLVGGSIDVHGAIGDDLRVIGGEVIIAEPVTGNVFVVGRNVTILSTATVGGDVLVFGGDVTVSGTVEGSIVGQATTLRVDGTVNGDVNVTVDALILGDKAVVAGGVMYVSNEQLVRAQNAAVTGEIVRNDAVVDDTPLRPTLVVIPFLMLLFSVLVWYLIGRSLLQAVVDRTLQNSLRPTLIGLTTIVVAPLGIVILLVSVLGTLVGIVALFAYLLAIILSVVGMGAVAGMWLQKAFNQSVPVLSIPAILLGTFFVIVCALLPIVGPLIILVLFIVTIGSLVDIVIRPSAV